MRSINFEFADAVRALLEITSVNELKDFLEAETRLSVLMVGDACLKELLQLPW